MNQAQDLLAIHLGELGCEFVSEYRFHRERTWRLDFFIPEKSIGIEIEGAVWTQGRHTRGNGFLGDIEKYNHAIMSGIKLLRFSTQDVLNGKAKKFLERFIKE